ncbi:hypothetical protein D9M68_708410 [compost metagenome]
MQRAHALVDVEAVGMHADGMHLGTQFAEDMRSDVVRGAVGGVHYDRHPIQVLLVREGALAELDVTALRVGHAAGAAQGFRADAAQRLVQRGLDRRLDIVGQLHALCREELDAVVMVRVMRSADDDTGHETQGPRQIGHRRRRDRAGQQHIDARGRQAGFQGGFQHIAGDPRVLADHDLRAACAAHGVLARQHAASRIAQPQGELGVDHRTANLTAHAISAEILASNHEVIAPCSAACHTFSASTVAATSCTRTMEAPRATQASAAAMLPGSLSFTGRPVAWPIMFLRDRPISNG